MRRVCFLFGVSSKKLKFLENVVASYIGTLTVRGLRSNLLHQTVRFFRQLANLYAQFLPLPLQIADELLYSSQFCFQWCGRARSVSRDVTGVSSRGLQLLSEYHQVLFQSRVLGYCLFEFLEGQRQL